MAIPTTSLDAFRQHLSRLGLKSGDDVVLHASLLSFGLLEGAETGAWSVLRQVVSDEATIAVPTFTTHLTSDQVFDPDTTPSRGMGALSEYVRTLPGTIRTKSPMHSYAANGAKANKLIQADPTLSFGPNSIFDFFLHSGFRLLLLGCPFELGATYVHQIEARIGVPYRRWLTLPRQIKQADGSVSTIKFRYYGRDQTDKRYWSSKRIFNTLMLDPAQPVSWARAPRGMSYILDFPCLDRIGGEMVEQNSHVLLFDSQKEAEALPLTLPISKGNEQDG